MRITCLLSITFVHLIYTTFADDEFKPLNDVSQFVKSEGDTVKLIVVGQVGQSEMESIVLTWIKAKSVKTLSGTTGEQIWSVRSPEMDQRWTTRCFRDNRTCQLQITNLRIEDDGWYVFQYQMNNQQGFFSKAINFTLTIQAPAKAITMEGSPTKQVEKGVATNLTCTSTGSNPAVTLEWSKNGEKITSGIHQSFTVESDGFVNTLGVLTITPTVGSVLYKCKASGSMMGTAILEASLTTQLTYPPELSISGDAIDSVHKAGEEITLTCNANANPAVTAWTWKLDGAERITTATSGSSSSLTILLDKTMNGKSVACEAENSLKKTSTTYTLNVHYAPSWVEKPITKSADVGDSLEFTCKIDGNPVGKVFWTRLQEPSSSMITQVESGEEKFILNPVTENDFGAYRCTGLVTGFPNIYHTFHILKKGQPIIERKAAVTAQIRKDTMLTCTAQSIPKPTRIVWTRYDTPGVSVTENNDRLTISRSETVDGVISTLHIENIATKDYGFYNCTVVNERGEDSRLFELVQDDSFPWMYTLIGIGSAIALVIVIILIICCCRRKKRVKTSSAVPWSIQPKAVPVNVQPQGECSLSVVSNTTDSSVKKPADGMEMCDLPEYIGPGPVDTWHTHPRNVTSPYPQYHDEQDYPKPELYGTFRGQPAANAYAQRSYDQLPSTVKSNYGSYRVEHPTQPEEISSPYYYHHSNTLPNRRYPDGMEDPPYPSPTEKFPDPPASFLATNV